MQFSTQELQKIKHKIQTTIDTLQLDLFDINVLTEVGSHYFLFTPLIALMANAEKVFAWAKDSRYGKAEDNVKDLIFLLDYFKIDKNKIEFSQNERPILHIQQANIITNSGLVRPLNKEFLQNASPNAVIPLMYEAWELRNSDIDIDFCREKNIKVAGTWENYPSLRIFDYVGALCVKLAQEAGFEIFQNKIIVWSDDHFGELAQKAFQSLEAKEVILTTDIEILEENIKNTDFVFFCDSDEKRQILGENGFLNLENLKNLNPLLEIVHLYGDLSYDFLQKNNVKTYPNFDGKALVMSHTLSYLGITPLVGLQTAGLKVGECLYKKEYQHPILQLLN